MPELVPVPRRRRPQPTELSRLPEPLQRTLMVPLPTPDRYERALLIQRISLDRPTSTSMARQDEGVAQYATEVLGLLPVAEAADHNVSARYVPPWERPELRKWFVDPDHVAQWDTAVFYKIDRLFRNRGDLAAIELWCDITGRRLACVLDHIDLSTPQGRMIAGIHVGLAQAEAEITGGRVRDTQEWMRGRGYYTGGTIPFGHTKVRDGTQWVYAPHPQWVHVAAAGLEAIADGMAMHALAEAWNDRRIPTSKMVMHLDAGVPEEQIKRRYWTIGSIKAWARNRIHVGESTYSGRVMLTPEGDPIPRSSPIVDREVFEAVQRRLDEVAIKYSRRTTSNEVVPIGTLRINRALFYRVAFCPACEQPMTRKTEQQRTKSGVKKYLYYVCPKRLSGCANFASIQESHVKEFLDSWIREAEDGSGNKLTDVEMVKIRTIHGDDTSEKIAATKKALEVVRKEWDLGLMDNEEEYLQRVKQLKERLASLESKPTQGPREEVTPLGVTYGEWWSRASWAERTDWLRNAGVRLYFSRPYRGGPLIPRVHVGESFEALMKAARQLPDDMRYTQRNM